MKRIIRIAAAAALLLAGLAARPAAAGQVIKLGVENGPHAEIAELVKKLVAKDGSTSRSSSCPTTPGRTRRSTRATWTPTPSSTSRTWTSR